MNKLITFEKVNVDLLPFEKVELLLMINNKFSTKKDSGTIWHTLVFINYA